MGGQISHETKVRSFTSQPSSTLHLRSLQLGENELVRRFSGLEPITDNDPFWNTLVSFNLREAKTRLEQRAFDENLRDSLEVPGLPGLFSSSTQCSCLELEALLYNAPTTGNFAAFVRVTLRRCGEVKAAAVTADKISLWQTRNALVVLRITVTFLAERLSESELLKTFCKSVLTQDGLAQQLVEELRRERRRSCRCVGVGERCG